MGMKDPIPMQVLCFPKGHAKEQGNGSTTVGTGVGGRSTEIPTAWIYIVAISKNSSSTVTETRTPTQAGQKQLWQQHQ
jgi:hypothetical protein